MADTRLRRDTRALRLKTCPCCGSKAYLHQLPDDHRDENAGGYFIQCDNGGCELSSALMFACGDDPRPQLAERWNRRAVISKSTTP